jgi:hypothetical protein
VRGETRIRSRGGIRGTTSWLRVSGWRSARRQDRCRDRGSSGTHISHDGAIAETAALVLATLGISASGGADNPNAPSGDRGSAALPRETGSRGSGGRPGWLRSKPVAFAGRSMRSTLLQVARTGSFSAAAELASLQSRCCPLSVATGAVWGGDRASATRRERGGSFGRTTRPRERRCGSPAWMRWRPVEVVVCLRGAEHAREEALLGRGAAAVRSEPVVRVRRLG